MDCIGTFPTRQYNSGLWTGVGALHSVCHRIVFFASGCEIIIKIGIVNGLFIKRLFKCLR